MISCYNLFFLSSILKLRNYWGKVFPQQHKCICLNKFLILIIYNNIKNSLIIYMETSLRYDSDENENEDKETEAEEILMTEVIHLKDPYE